MNILDFNLYIFDLDGTIINSEFTHYESYNNLLINKISYTEYQQIFHSNIKSTYLKDNYIDKSQKEQIFYNNYKPEYINGFEEFFKELILLGKEIIVVTNSSYERIDFIKEMHPLLKQVHRWYGNSGTLEPKPHADNYVKAITDSGVPFNEIIIFEDSYTGYLSIESLDIAKIFICDSTYFYYNKIKETIVEDYTTLTYNFEIARKDTHLARNKIDKYITELSIHKDNLTNTVSILYSLLKDKINKKNIFLLGVGKCGHICNKVASTWSSIGICAFSNSVEDLLHGEFAKIKTGDIILFLSNSGNTQELINASTHLKENYNVIQIGLTFNKESKLKELMDIYIPITTGVSEACHLNKAPTISSVLFMTILDSVGTLISEHILSIKKEAFTLFHPGGTLGRVKPLDTVVICACGKGTRLMPLTTSIPKYCVNIDNFNILTHIVQYWKQYTDTILLIIDKKNNDITSFYMNQLNIQYTILNVEIKDQENAYTLYHALKDKSSYNRILITWCDLFPSSPIPISAFKRTTVFTHGTQSRYTYDTNQIIKRSGGNVIGIYYFDEFKPMLYDNDKQDVCDILSKHYTNMRSYNIDTINDVGDMDKLVAYQQIINTNNISRYFNRITELPDNRIKKESVHVDGNTLLKREIKYYNAIANLNLPFPAIHDKTDTSFIMQKCKGGMVKDNKSPATTRLVLSSLQNIHSKIIREVSPTVFYRDLEIEFSSKIKERIRQIDPIVKHFGEVNYVNGVSITVPVNSIIDHLFKDIWRSTSDMKYNILHGDCNFSNIFIDTNNTLTFIDPRGYYGKTFLFGYKYYDYSKVLYALSGYDRFNTSENFFVTLDADNIMFNMEDTDLTQYRSIFDEYEIDWELCLKMCALHWLGLSQYISNNIHKSIAAYYHGIALYHSIYNIPITIS